MEQLIKIAGDRAALDNIARPHAALAIWWRRLPEPLCEALQWLDLSAVDDLSVEVGMEGSVLAALNAAGYTSACATMLSLDIDQLVRRHAALTGDDRLRVRLTGEASDPHSRFQASHVSLRLLCTYIGPGTQWCCVEGQDAICEIPTGSVGVFKGRSLLDPPAVLHRSSPSGAHRLLLTIDPSEG